MPGSKTRFGFSGAGEPLPLSGGAPDAPRAARTVFGHEAHLPGRASTPRFGVPAATRAAEPRSGVPETVSHGDSTEKVTGHRTHSGKSKFPAIARMLGRWTTGGGFLARSRPHSGQALPGVSRGVWLSRIAILVGAALLSFLIALAVMKAGRLG